MFQGQIVATFGHYGSTQKMKWLAQFPKLFCTGCGDQTQVAIDLPL